MMRILFLFSMVLASFGFGSNSLFAFQTAGIPMNAASETDHSDKSLTAEMMSHQSEMKALMSRLEESVQAVSDARDAKGYVHDKEVIKAHGANIKALRDAVRDHKLFLATMSTNAV